MRITDKNNPLERCKLRIYEYSEEWFDGIVSYDSDKQEVTTWIMYDNISKQILYSLCKFISKNFFTIHIKTRQENILTCFVSRVITPIDTCPMDLSGLIMIRSGHWIENYHIKGVSELFINEAEFSFPYTEYWFKKTLDECKGETIRINENLSLLFLLEEKTIYRTFEQKKETYKKATVRISSAIPMSIEELYELQEQLLLLFRYCSNLWLPKASINIIDKVENSFNQYIEERPKERTIFTPFHYIYRLKGANELPEPNQIIDTNLSLEELIKNPYYINNWLDSFKSKIYPMRLIGDSLYSTHIELSERLLKLILAFEPLAKSVYTNYKKEKLTNWLIDAMTEFNIKIDDLFSDQITPPDIAKKITHFRNCISHGDNYDNNTNLQPMETIMHRILIPFLKKHILQPDLTT